MKGFRCTKKHCTFYTVWRVFDEGTGGAYLSAIDVCRYFGRGNCAVPVAVVVLDPLDLSPIQANVSSPFINQVLTYIVTVSNGVGPYTYLWTTITDNQTATHTSSSQTDQVTFTFVDVGTYTVTVVVTDSLGATGTASKLQLVTDPGG